MITYSAAIIQNMKIIYSPIVLLPFWLGFGHIFPSQVYTNKHILLPVNVEDGPNPERCLFTQYSRTPTDLKQTENTHI